jgi:hypothetical protein
MCSLLTYILTEQGNTNKELVQIFTQSQSADRCPVPVIHRPSRPVERAWIEANRRRLRNAVA